MGLSRSSQLSFVVFVKNVFFWLLLTLVHSESIMETCSVVLTFESVDEILWCDHSNETSSTVLFHRRYHLFFSTLQYEIWDLFVNCHVLNSWV